MHNSPSYSLCAITAWQRQPESLLGALRNAPCPRVGPGVLYRSTPSPPSPSPFQCPCRCCPFQCPC
eukprot:2962587-Rhodomonas_salina.1